MTNDEGVTGDDSFVIRHSDFVILLNMLSHVQIFCFMASYTVALALEVSRLWFRSGIRGVVMLAFVVAGWIAHTAYLYNAAVATVGSHNLPLSSNQDWLLLAA